MYSSAKPIPLFRKYTIELLISSRDHITRKKKDKQASIYEFNKILTRMTTQIILKINHSYLTNYKQKRTKKNWSSHYSLKELFLIHLLQENKKKIGDSKQKNLPIQEPISNTNQIVHTTHRPYITTPKDRSLTHKRYDLSPEKHTNIRRSDNENILPSAGRWIIIPEDAMFLQVTVRFCSPSST